MDRTNRRRRLSTSPPWKRARLVGRSAVDDPLGAEACEVGAAKPPDTRPRVARPSAPVSKVCGKMAPRAATDGRHNSVIVCLAIRGVSVARASSRRRNDLTGPRWAIMSPPSLPPPWAGVAR
ncbi:hypothetical protein LSAT2_023240 [Lamellibrachia satsuma]|nr:hypothetical protein LSAT2_023240 [Lamellibrachia satsuma]